MKVRVANNLRASTSLFSSYGSQARGFDQLSEEIKIRNQFAANTISKFSFKTFCMERDFEESGLSSMAIIDHC